MSIEIMVRVWNQSKQGGSPLLLLLAIADNANDAGFAWPGQEYLAKKIRMSTKSIPRLTKKLQEAGELFIHSRASQGKVTQYIVTVGMDWSQLEETLKFYLKYDLAQIAFIQKGFRGGQVGGPSQVGRGVDIAVGRGVDIAVGRGVDIAVSTEPSLTINEPSTPGKDFLQDFQDEVATSVVETMDREIMSDAEGDDLSVVFGENPRQAEISAHQEKPRMTREELMLAALGAVVAPPIRIFVGRMRDGGWQVKDGELERNLAAFFVATEFNIPSTKAQRRAYEAGVREHMGEEAFKGRLGELYQEVWTKIKPLVLADEITATRPQSFTQWMYQAVNVDQIRANQPLVPRSTILSRLKLAGLVRLEDQSDDVTDYVWVESGSPVGEIPDHLIQQYG